MQKLFWIVLCLTCCGTVRWAAADVVTDWDPIANNTVNTDTANSATHQPGPGWASRNLAMTMAAVCDAIDSATTTRPYSTYAYTGQTYANASKTAAAAYAAHDVLASLYGSSNPTTNQQTTLDNDLNVSLTGIAGQALADGKTLGQAVALAVINKRASDGSGASNSYTTTNTLGHYQLQPGQTAWGPVWGNVTPFVLNATQMTGNSTLIANKINTLVPGATSLTSNTFLSSPAFATAFNQVMSLGAATGSTRTLDQTKAGYYWAYDVGGLGPPPILYNEILQNIANSKGNTVQQNARLFALANMAMADASIVSWKEKFLQDFFRPITAAQEGASLAAINSGITSVNTSWTPLGAPSVIIPNASSPPGTNAPFTPPFPAFTSGHASFGGALFETLRDFYGTDNIGFTFTSDNLPNDPRTFTTLSQAETENAYSRVYLGIHWSFDADIGSASGDLIGDNVFSSMIVPTPEPSTFVLAGLGLLGLIGLARRRKAAPNQS